MYTYQILYSMYHTNMYDQKIWSFSALVRVVSRKTMVSLDSARVVSSLCSLQALCLRATGAIAPPQDPPGAEF